MNLTILKFAEKKFLEDYPGGFASPEMVEIGKKHKMEKMIEFAQESFNKSKFIKPKVIVENMIKIVSRSSMVSLFEKPKFKDFCKGLSPKKQKVLANGLENLLHGNQEEGFNIILNMLTEAKLAKWSLITIIPAYFHPNEEVFVKPTTAKGVITVFELKKLLYQPRPSWEFYIEYRKQIQAMKKKVSKKLSPNNAAFSGFLMMVCAPIK